VYLSIFEGRVGICLFVFALFLVVMFIYICSFFLSDGCAIIIFIAMNHPFLNENIILLLCMYTLFSCTATSSIFLCTFMNAHDRKCKVYNMVI
jgi:hypothetical protein